MIGHRKAIRTPTTRSVGKYPEPPANGFAGETYAGQQRLQNQGIIGIILDEPLTCVQFVTGILRGPAMPIDPSLEQGAFEPEATAAMGEAFDAACKELHRTRPLEGVREFIAALIVAAARQGELDPVRLRMAALVGFAITQRRQPRRASNAARAAS